MDWLNGNLQRAFRANRGKAWTAGLESLDVEYLESGPLQLLSGSIPPSLRGVFYRNGPARHERGVARYSHKWDADGMVQAFRIGDDGIRHMGRYVSTKKHLNESAADALLTSTFATPVLGMNALNTDVDEMNVANISVTMFNNELLALWEAGSAYALDPKTLQTIGVKDWRAGELVRPFSAHPKIDSSGTMWNFGSDPINGVLTIFKISNRGQVEAFKRFNVEKLPPIHDFAVTARHMVFLMPPMEFDTERLRSGHAFARASAWRPNLGTRVLVVRKDTWTCKWHELPPMAGFHIGNAWEDSLGTIRLDFMGAQNPTSMFSGWTMMAGEYSHAKGAVMTLAEIRANGGASLELVDALEAEFPVVDPAVVGSRYRKVLCLERTLSRPANLPGWDAVCMFDVDDRHMNSFCFGDGYVVEEHVFAGAPGRGAEWVIGVVLNLSSRRTELTIFEASNLSAGPVGVAGLPYALPFGLHGHFHHAHSR
ncbi:carotenoid oxygenase family protein [Variovorax sp. YR216]|uniref:carotenoid oxygenase family protein n=1 Tax=Variovorax sp. YR216 TaxID=1882828 RepID=UPI00089AF991|nr:carotenoid oxygenase family protein [Variovorax sp. YR216]SEB26347.1 Carotenoid cleavage dioxygenase [Variovorax sp. YR216]